VRTSADEEDVGRGDEQDGGIVWIRILWHFIIGRGRTAWPPSREETHHFRNFWVLVLDEIRRAGERVCLYYVRCWRLLAAPQRSSGPGPHILFLLL